MSIKDFQSKIRSENSVLFSALRKLKNIDDTQKVIGVKSEMVAWNAWPTLDLRTSVCS